MQSDVAAAPTGMTPALLLLLPVVANAGECLFFGADGSTYSEELFKSDGTAAGTTLVRVINSAGGAGVWENSDMVAMGGYVFFAGYGGTGLSGGSTGVELWKSDGTAANTTLVKDINNDPGNEHEGPAGSYPSMMVVMGDNIYFHADDGINGRELWKSDGTAIGTTLVKDIRSGSEGAIEMSPAGRLMVTVGDAMIYFAARGDDTGYGNQLWKSDGSDSGTILVKDIEPRQMVSMGDHVYFQARRTGDAFSDELWKSDGTDSGTMLVKDIFDGGSSYPANMVALGNHIYFSANGPSQPHFPLSPHLHRPPPHTLLPGQSSILHHFTTIDKSST